LYADDLIFDRVDFVKQCLTRFNDSRLVLKVQWEIFRAYSPWCIVVSYTFLKNFVSFYLWFLPIYSKFVPA